MSGGSVKVCLEPGCSRLGKGTRCAIHTKTTTQRGYGAPWQRVAKAAIRAQPWCSWCLSRDDLTADHIDNADPSKGVQVLCRGCNSRRRRLDLGPDGLRIA